MKKTPGKKPARKPVAAKKPVPRSRPPSTKTHAKPAPKKKPAVSVADKQANALEKTIIQALENLKGKNIVRMDVRKLTDVMDTIIIASGTSNRHVKSLADNARVEAKKNGYRVYGAEGEDAGEWVLVDFGTIVLHVMQPHVREFYDLEKLWNTPLPPRQPATDLRE
jgi:ribosome-associated protein